MKPFILAACLLVITVSEISAQDDSTNLEVKYQRIKDSLALLYPSIPAVSSILIKEKQFEVNLYNSLLSANKYRDEDGDMTDYTFRQTYLFTTLQVNYGVSKNDRLNVGIGIQTVTGRVDQDRHASIFKVFNRNTDAGSLYASAVTAIIPRIRWRPFSNNYKFTVQSSLSVPTSISSEKQSVLGKNQVFFLNQFIYNHPLNDRFFLLSQLSLQYGFKRDNVRGVFYVPVSGYLSYFLPRKTVLFALLNYVPIFTKDNHRFTFQSGAGVQHQLTRNILINGFYTNDLFGKNYADFSSYTIGVRWVSN